ncbi:FAD-dependent oxidoreductase [Undibacterium cyanobacteriorum]|uniref:FAD-dependent oxidoreductase n=1 Tax=Undibacterium cyanobacteriorum TaxID=3073561 RepID=A0ABY9RNQ0_9BURK|nr:FAD-dependent oxidoreductase [Undibacterium sp. 20NA77.5]WMW82062.1 FAD-dependent oxidoreductase [Undibacterium sp. 20NA77.5]
MKPIFVIGSGMAGVSLIRELRKLDTSTPIILVTADDGGFYSKPMLSNAFAQNKLPAQLKTQTATQLAEQLAITILHQTQLQKIESDRHVIHTSMGEFEYHALVLAVGAQAIRLPIQGSGANQIMSVNHLDDYAKFRDRLEQISQSVTNPTIAILGAGLIGCEFADDLNQAGFEVHLFDPNPSPLAALLPPTVSLRLQQQLEAKGIHFHLNDSVTSVEDQGDNLKLTTKDGGEFEVHLVLSAVGLIPNKAIAQQCHPTPLHTDRGIVVDANGMTSAPDIYALGDCAQYTVDTDGNSSVLPYIAPILAAARAIAKSLADSSTQKAHRIELGPMPVIIKTPSCPIAVLPPSPQVRAKGKWLDEHLADDTLISRFVLDDGRLAGFALTPNNAKIRNELLALMNAR